MVSTMVSKVMAPRSGCVTVLDRGAGQCFCDEHQVPVAQRGEGRKSLCGRDAVIAEAHFSWSNGWMTW